MGGPVSPAYVGRPSSDMVEQFARGHHQLLDGLGGGFLQQLLEHLQKA